MPEDKEIKKWGKDIVPIIEKKLESLNTWGNYLDRKYQARIRITERNYKGNSLEKWFCLEYANAEYEERHFVSKWQRYWLELWDKVNDNPIKTKTVRQSLNLERAREYPIENLYQDELRRVGGRLTGKCPFHEERTASFFIFKDNKFRCFGCQENGDSIDYVMKTRNYSFAEAVRNLS